MGGLSGRNSLSQGHVLIVEDERPTQAVLKRIVGRLGVSVTAVGGTPAYYLLQEPSPPYHLAVCNLRLREIDSRWVVEETARIGLAVVLVAPVYAEFEAREVCRLGADSVWAMPVDTDRFLDRAAHLVRRGLDAEARAAGCPRTVLVVDDDEATRRVLCRTLARAGIRVLEAPNGLQAIQIASRVPVDLVVLDVNMPGMSGISTCEVLKTQRATAATPVLICTVQSDSESQLRAIAAAADGYLVKPFRPETFLERVTLLLGAGQRPVLS